MLWVANRQPMAQSAREALAEAEQNPGGILVSPISAWELGQLVARGRLALPRDPFDWFEAVVQVGIGLAPMPPEVLVASSFLPGTMLRDPADKIMAATARAFGYRLMTRDKPLLDFAGEGHMQAIAC